MKPEELGQKLTAAGERRLESDMLDICKSMASFIAEIDADSNDVAAYLYQRLNPILRHPAVRLHLDRVGKDGRKLVRAKSE